MFFFVYTLGCKLNQLETEAISDAFRRGGFTLLPSPEAAGSPAPDIIVVNTCTVTSAAEQKARRYIRRQLRDFPEACVIVTGCYAQVEREALAALEDEPEYPFAAARPRRLFVVPGEKKDRVLDLPAFLAGAAACGADLPELAAAWLASFNGADAEGGGSFRFRPESFSAHSRGFLKIQDGCDRRCSYCRVSLARGKSRSLESGEVLLALLALEERGIAEAVLTGVSICQYRDSGLNLPRLLDFLLAGTSRIRLRLSSIEPDALDAEFARVLENPRIRPHFHLALQSGSAAILAKMGRPYGPADIESGVGILRGVKDDPFLACDIIAGFPGESGDDFEETYRICEKAGFAWIHAFPFSPRPGTPALNFSGRVSEKEVSSRVEALTKLAVWGRAAYVERQTGKEVELVVESGKKIPRGVAAGVSEQYLKLLVSPGGRKVPAPGSLVRCRILRKEESGAFDARAEMLPSE